MPFQQPDVAERTGGGGDQFGEFQIVAQIGRVGGFDFARLADETARHVDAPAGTGLAADRRAVGPVDSLANREGAGDGGLAGVPDVQHAFAAADGFQNQAFARLKIVAGHEAAVPLQDFDARPPGRAGLHGHQRRGAGPADAREDQIDQPHIKLRIGRGSGDDLGQAAQHVDVGVGVAELDLLQIARAERLFLSRLRDVERNVHPFVGQSERRLADHEMFSRFQVETGGRLAADKNRIAGRGQPIDAQPRAVPADLSVIAADAVIPGGRPAGRAAAEHDRSAGQQRSPPAVLRIDSLGDQVGHG